MRKLIFAVVALIAVGTCGVLVAGRESAPRAPDAAGEAMTQAVNVIAISAVDVSVAPDAACVDEVSCLRQYYQTLAWQVGPAEALATLGQQSDLNPLLAKACHDTTHAIGEIAARMKPISDAMLLGDQRCGSGYYHGIIATTTIMVEPEALHQVLIDGCSVGDNGSFSRWECFHGVGHGYTFVANGKILEAIASCGEIANDLDRAPCASGAFMQELVDHGKDAMYAADPYVTCKKVTDPVSAHQCYDMLANIVVQHRNTAELQFAECATAPLAYQEDCYRGLGRSVFSGMPLRGPESEKYCGAAPQGVARDLCYAGIVENTAAFYGSSNEASTHCVEFSTDALRKMCATVLDKQGISS
jgi:hypothetical protein